MFEFHNVEFEDILILIILLLIAMKSLVLSGLVGLASLLY